MPELRKDPIIGRWVIIATERAKRPHDFSSAQEGPTEGECPFCEGREEKTPPEIFAFRKPNSQKNKSGWEVRVVPSIAPILRIEGELNRHGAG
ncbi:MAG: galactose-1-phosphate uridylyltransferase, partial [Candidatus Omnitrophica bacterium]|nr:galactose-1-phosphate uridylyltransferase [Candidatus Omnitrophota bacterium]